MAKYLSSFFMLLLLQATEVSGKPGSLTTNYLERARGLEDPPRFSWINDHPTSPSSARGFNQTSYRIVVSLDEGGNSTVWDSGVVESSQSTFVPYGGTTALDSASTYYWRVATELSSSSTLTSTSSEWSSVAIFSTGLVNGRKDWGSAEWITGGDSRKLLRAEFNIPADADLSTAKLFVSGIGYHEVYINGGKVGDHKLDSSWSDNARRNYYATHEGDVLASLLRENSVIGVMMGNGWYACDKDNAGGTTQPGCVDAPPQLILALMVEGKFVVVSDSKTWKTSAGPITYDSLYNGEHYDARLEQDGWTTNGFDDSAWTLASSAESQTASSSPLVSSAFEPIRIVSAREPESSSSPAPGLVVYDFGQNLAGIVRISGLRCASGVNITIRHAELLMHEPYGPADGNIYVGNLRAAQATDIYTCKGDPDGETYEPRFTQHGFRFAEVHASDGEATWDRIESLEMHTDVRQHSRLEFSEAVSLLNKIQQNVLWGQKSNLMSVPTDCPQRDERRGWSGDASLTAELATINFQMGAFYTHYLNQIQDDQQNDGAVTNFVPSLGTGDGAPNWQTVYPSLVYALFKYNGDVAPVKRHYDSLKRYYAYLDSKYNETGIKNYMTGFGDWCPPPPAVKANGHLVGAFAYLYSLKLGAEFFDAAGYKDDALHCTSMFESVSKEFHDAFWNETHYLSGLQAEQALPLYLDIVPDDVKDQVLNYTVNDIVVTNDVHTTCGIIGIKCLLETLTDNGHGDVALEMVAHVDTYPSYGYMVTGGGVETPATTIWELWDSPAEGPGMNSRNHIMFGTVGSWMYKSLAGITPIEAGYGVIGIAPTGIGGRNNMTSAYASVGTPLGDVVSSWSIDATSGKYTHLVSVPVGATAQISVPATSSDAAIVREGGAVVWRNGAFALDANTRGIPMHMHSTREAPCPVLSVRRDSSAGEKS
eukprot:g379.t1